MIKLYELWIWNLAVGKTEVLVKLKNTTAKTVYEQSCSTSEVVFKADRKIEKKTWWHNLFHK